MTARWKLALVFAGYVAALLLAWAAVALNHIGLSEADGVASGGMTAIADTILFAGVFLVLAGLVSLAGMYSLRKHAYFRPGLGMAALAVVSLLTAVTFLLAW